MAVVRISTDLPLPAERACALARKPELFLFVVRPIFRATGLPPGDFEAHPGQRAERAAVVVRRSSARLAPPPHDRRARTDRDRDQRARRLRAQTWDHRLTFEPRGASACRYTDEVTLDAGALTPLVRLFAHGIFRWRQARWRALARVIAPRAPP